METTQSMLQATANAACDYLRIHKAFWPRVYLNRPAWVTDKDAKSSYALTDWDNYIENPESWVNMPMCRVENVSPVRILMHEVAHIYVEHSTPFKYYHEKLADIFERLLFDLVEGGIIAI